MSHIQDDESSHEHKSRVVAFHSKHQWNTHFAASKDSNKLMVIYFTATWCGPCRAMEPIFRDYADKFTDVEFVKLDVDELYWMWQWSLGCRQCLHEQYLAALNSEGSPAQK